MTNVLEKICTDKRALVEKQKREKPMSALDLEARAAPPPRAFAKSLRARTEKGRIAVIAEIKKASPSAGVIRSHYSPAALAESYAAAGAACLSVLTDVPYFQGRNEDLIQARAACGLPVLRKDFMLDPWQVAEARMIGADCILLIMAALETPQAAELHAAATSYGMDVLIEVHDRSELDRALRLPPSILGINNRDLKTLKVDLGTTEALAPLAPAGRVVVSESGVVSPADIARLKRAGVHCFLVGESLLKQPDVKRALLALQEGA